MPRELRDDEIKRHAELRGDDPQTGRLFRPSARVGTPLFQPGHGRGGGDPFGGATGPGAALIPDEPVEKVAGADAAALLADVGAELAAEGGPVEKAADHPGAAAGASVRRRQERADTVAVEYDNDLTWIHSTVPEAAPFVGAGVAALQALRDRS